MNPVEDSDSIKKEMSRWSLESRDRHYFELKVNAFLKTEISRLENEVMSLRVENQKLRERIESAPVQAKQNVSTCADLEID